MKKKHIKHPFIPKPRMGKYGRNEWAILGTKCSLIKDLSYKIIHELIEYKCTYIDADHKSGDEPMTEHSALASGASVEVTDAIHYFNVKLKDYPNEYDDKAFFSGQDLILINGNHFQAKRQVLVIDPNKENSVRKRLNQLTQVEMILKIGNTPLFDFARDTIQNWSEIPTFEIQQVSEIVSFFRNKLNANKPGIKGLVLAGGKSTRMGQDKGKINYHGQPQREYAFNLLQKLNIPSYISCRAEQVEELKDYPTIPDRISGLGPFGAILSAYMTDPDTAWLIIACDLPNLNEKMIKYLINHRNPSKIATSYHNGETGFPDPLCTIFEPKAYPRFHQFLYLGYSCPRKVLINSDTHVVQPEDSSWLKNVNTPDELSAFQSK